MIPNFVEELEELDKLDGHQVIGKNVSLKVEAVIQPQVLTTTLGRRWLETYTPPPRNKQVQKRFRLTLLDGVLVVCRMLRDAFMTDLIALGEGSISRVAVSPHVS